MKFRVTCGKPLPIPGVRNPFLLRDVFSLPPQKVLCRTWEFEAEDEAEVRQLFAEAQAEGVVNVQGFTIRTIERVS